MSPEQVRKLVGGYATGTLTPEERRALFDAALTDQELFDSLAREQSLRDLLSDPAAKAGLMAALGEAPVTWRQRAASWMWGHAAALAAAASLAMVAGFVAWQMRVPPRQEVAVVTTPAAPGSHGSQPPAAPQRRVFDVQGVKKPAALPTMPAPPVFAQGPAVAHALPPGIAGAYPRIPSPAAPLAQPAPRQDVAVHGITDLDTAGNAIQHFEPTLDTIAESRVLTAPGGRGGSAASAGAGGFGGLRSVAATGVLTGTLVDSSGAAVPGAQVEARDLTTGAVRATVSGPEGTFVFSSLPPARYSVSAKAAGFKTYAQNNIDIAANAAHDLGKVPLALGAVTEEIAVSAAATPVQTASSEDSKLVDESQMANLTLKGRDMFAEMPTVPGVSLGTTYSTAGAAVGTSKLDPRLVALIHGLHAAAPAALVIVRITLTDATKDALAQLKNAGFAIGRRQRNDVTGRIAVEKLETVANLPFVVRIAPQ